MTLSSIPGIILAAGKSQRMGKNKLLLMFRGKPILQHVIDAAQHSSLSPLILVLGANSDALRSQIKPGISLVVENPDFACGYGSSLQVGLKKLNKPCAGAMFLLGDQPLLSTKTIEKLIVAFQKEPERWVAPSWNGQRGNPVITPASWFDKIFALTGDIGPRKHLKDPAANLKLINVDDRGVILDIDSPEDYEYLLNL
jgi:molybdenum cofactor cytidylyltransferase